MPAPAEYQTQTTEILEGQKVFTQMKAIIAQTAFQKMVDYNPTGLGTYSGPYEWVCPDGPIFLYESGAGELKLDGIVYSSLGSEEKIIFHRWLPQFSKRFVLKYNKENGI